MHTIDAPCANCGATTGLHCDFLAWVDERHDVQIGSDEAMLRDSEHRVRAMLPRLEVAYGEQDWDRIESILGAIFVICSSPVSRWTPFSEYASYPFEELISAVQRVGRGTLAQRRKTLRIIAESATCWIQ